RLPEDDKAHQLPASFGAFPLYNTAAYSRSLPQSMVEKGGIFFPMWQREAMFIRFKTWRKDTKYAVRVLVGGINAITGLVRDEETERQDYFTVPDQPWLDGILVESGTVRQFVAMPLGRNYTVEGQLTNQEKAGGIEIEVFPLKTSSEKHFWDGKPGRSPRIPSSSSPLAAGLMEGDYISMSGEAKTERLMQLKDSILSLDGLPSEVTFTVPIHSLIY
ncbi:hypothetical protein BK809_0004967, partial [Diplodia seriata]